RRVASAEPSQRLQAPQLQRRSIRRDLFDVAAGNADVPEHPVVERLQRRPPSPGPPRPPQARQLGRQRRDPRQHNVLAGTLRLQFSEIDRAAHVSLHWTYETAGFATLFQFYARNALPGGKTILRPSTGSGGGAILVAQRNDLILSLSKDAGCRSESPEAIRYAAASLFSMKSGGTSGPQQ